jgi:Spy/CpxP family protein refolding chaperone
MILAIGLGVLGLFAMRRAHRRCRAYHFYGHGGGYGYGGPGCGGPGHGDDWQGHWGGPPWARRRWMLHAALARIDATPAQERAIVAEIDRFKDRARAVRSSFKEGRGDLAAAIRGDVLDDAALGAALGRADGAHAEIRSAAIDALRGIHNVLDPKQRAQVAELLDRGGWWRRGPYR